MKPVSNRFETDKPVTGLPICKPVPVNRLTPPSLKPVVAVGCSAALRDALAVLDLRATTNMSGPAARSTQLQKDGRTADAVTVSALAPVEQGRTASNLLAVLGSDSFCPAFVRVS